MAILHRNRTLSAIMPRYAERFRCIGPRCEDTCCSGWPVHIDKKTYKAYRTQPHAALKPVLSRMQRIDHPPHAGMYAVLPVLGPHGSCPALHDGGCAIQATAGASYLPDTCDNFPRLNRYVNDQVEQSLTLSCPEAARLALLAEDAFDFVEAPISIREGTLFAVPAFRGMKHDAVEEMRIFCIKLMQTRELPLWQRLALLGTFCDAVDRHPSIAEPGVAQDLIDAFIQNIENGQLLAELAPVQANHGAQAMVFATLWASRGFADPSPHQHAHMVRIAAGLGGNISGQVSSEGLVAAYCSGLGRLDQAMAQVPWLLDHFLLNEMVSQQFPIGGERAFDGYLRLIARFGLLRLLLAAQCNAESALPAVSDLVATAGLQSRRFQHDPAFADDINVALRDSGWADLDKIFGLLRT